MFARNFIVLPGSLEKCFYMKPDKISELDTFDLNITIPLIRILDLA
jgi:hypothetical protein